MRVVEGAAAAGAEELDCSSNHISVFWQGVPNGVSCGVADAASERNAVEEAQLAATAWQVQRLGE